MQLGLNTCHLCPRHCGTDRRVAKGHCGAGLQCEVAAVCIHRGEEPPLSGLVNVFFSHCNLQCIYCQNWEISSASHDSGITSLTCLVEKICSLLPQSNGLLGLVTAAHYAHLLPTLLESVHAHGFHPTVVYNSSGYESVQTLQSLEGLVDIYLPDLKYMDSTLAEAYSHAPDYPTIAAAALKEMQRQVGASLKVDASSVAFRGMVVRHLVLPGQVENSLQCLEWLADNFPRTTRISLMAQYYPPKPDLPSPLDRTLTAEEYTQVCKRHAALGFSHGWLQELKAEGHYRPHFSQNGNPFEPQA